MNRKTERIMRALTVTAGLWVIAVSGLLADSAEGTNSFWGEGNSFLEVQEIARGEGVRFPTIVVAMNGTVVAFRCANGPITLRRSEDGGATWGTEITTSNASYKALGAAVVDENTGDVMVFPDHIEPAFTMYRSRDHGKTWAAEKVTKLPDGFGGIGTTHGGEHGITLRYGKKKGRLLMPARVFGPKNSNAREWRPYCYNSSIYSDDGGKSWQTSAPFPELGTGEGTLAELSNGHIYYNSRNHMAPNTMRRTATSYDGGEVWVNLQISDVLPDGPQDSAYGCKGGLVRLPLDDRDILISSNLDSPSGRRRGTVWASFDGGKTWPVKRLVVEGLCAYSSLNAGRSGTPSEGMIYLLIEGGKKHVYGGMQIARFNLPWLLGGEPTGDGEVPPLAEEQRELKKSLTVDLGDGVTMEFVRIEPGTFTMGSDEGNDGKPAHRVTLTQPFYMGKYEVTQEQWERVMGGNPSHFKGAKKPVDSVSWADCQNFLAKLKEKAPGHAFGLPTEAQWEYACRAGSSTEPTNWDEVASYNRKPPHPVGGKKPNAWGLFDMHGNVWEWCADWYGEYSASAQTDPTGPSSGRYRIMRGGSWYVGPGWLRASCRRLYFPGHSRSSSRGSELGLRCVVAVDGASAPDSPRLDAESRRTGETLYNGIVLPAIWPPQMAPSRDPMPVPYLDHPPALIPIDVGRQLFVDNFLIENTTLTRSYHQAEYHPANPVLRIDKPWEDEGGGKRYAFPFSDGVWYDSTDKKFKMWYMAGLKTMCYAESRDGIDWVKPKLDAVVPGSNIVWQTEGVRDSSTVWLDAEEKNPARRFKLFMMVLEGNQWRFKLHYSADGLRWSEPVASSACNSLPPFADRSTAFHNPFRNVWVYSLRWIHAPRSRVYMESADAETGLSYPGPAPACFWVGADKLDPRNPDPRFSDLVPQLYNLDGIAYESLILGQFAIWSGPDNNQARSLGLHKRCDILLGFSRDGFHWDRSSRQRFLPSSWKDDTWNFGNVQSASGSPLVVGDKLYFYVGGRGKDPSGNQANGTTGLATLRRDGFASMDAGADGGPLTTRPVTFSGSRLFVNVACLQGELRVEVLDRDGNVIAPFTKANCRPISIDKTLAAVTWKDGADLARLAGKPVKFRFHLSNGSLYAFWVSQDEKGASAGYVNGGPGFIGPTDTVGVGSYR